LLKLLPLEVDVLQEDLHFLSLVLLKEGHAPLDTSPETELVELRVLYAQLEEDVGTQRVDRYVVGFLFGLIR